MHVVRECRAGNLGNIPYNRFMSQILHNSEQNIRPKTLKQSDHSEEN